MPQTWTAYEESISESNHYGCSNHRKELGLPIDIDLLDIECSEASCRFGCPLG